VFKSFEPDIAGTIGDGAIAVTVPYGTDVTSLAPAITVSAGASVSPASGEARDFTSSVTYTVTAEDESTAEYTVTVEVEPSTGRAITAFVFESFEPGIAGTIGDGEIAVTVPYGTDVTSLAPTITVSAGASVSPASGAAQDFTSPVTYTVTAEDESTAEYTVTVDSTSAAAIALYLAAAPGGDTAAAPVPLTLSINLADTGGTGWAELLSAIQTADKYIALDLSACTMSGGSGASTEFDPQPGVSDAGEGKIASLVLPNGAESIKAAGGGTSGGSAFKHFTALASVSGTGIKTVGSFAFYNRDALTTVSFPVATSIDWGAFRYCNALETISLPSVTSIRYYAFSDCDALETVSLPASLTNISGNPFFGCTSLTSIIVDPGNPNYRHSADNKMLLSKNGTTLIGYPSAAGTITLTGITSIGGYAFFNCTALETVSLPAVTSIDAYAFSDCTALKTVSLPSATNTGDYAFHGCRTLETVSLPAATTIDDMTFAGCIALKTVSLPAATTIGTRAFEGCFALETLSLPAATSIGGYAFFYCTALETLSLPAATTIGTGAFYDCTALETLSLPAATSIGINAFFATGTKALTLTLGSTPPAVGTSMFSYVTAAKTVTVKVPSAALSAYGPSPTDTTADNWGNAFRGKGWDGTSYLGGEVNSYISLTITALP
jgi:hypothetical protein